MMRFERTIRKTHGVYHHFLSRLRDAFFVVNHDDIENLKRVLERRWFAQQMRRDPDADEVCFVTLIITTRSHAYRIV